MLSGRIRGSVVEWGCSENKGCDGMAGLSCGGVGVWCGVVGVWLK